MSYSSKSGDVKLHHRVHVLGHEYVDDHMVEDLTIHHFDIGFVGNIRGLFESSQYKDFTQELEFHTIYDIEEK